MGLGVLEPNPQGNIPGTCFILNDANRPLQAGEINSALKYDTRGTVPIILVPQPSDDPNDPLNWPLWKRDSILAILSIFSVIASTLSPLLAANTFTLKTWFVRDFTQLALLTGYHLLGVGLAGFLFVASARVWGKRHLYLLGAILVIVSSVWGGASGHNYSSILWARVFQGIGLAPFEALVNASVGDLYFVHERGTRMAVSNLAAFGGAFFAPVLVGKITRTLGWQWSFYFVAIFAGVMLPLLLFFVPETTFRRASYLNTDMNGEKNTSPQNYAYHLREVPLNTSQHRGRPNESGSGSFEMEPSDVENRKLTVQESGPCPSKVSFAHSLLPFNGRKTDESFLKLLFRPFPLFLHPTVFWACLTQGTLIGWTVMIGVVLAAVFLGPPLWFDEVKTGYLYTGAFIGAILGFLLSGLLSDWSTKVMIRRNKGIYEPEFRIILVLAQLVLGCTGLYGFGITGANVARYGWFWPDFFFSLVVMGMILGAVASALYIVDAHRDIAVEAFTCLLIFKNVFSFGVTWGAYDWLAKAGILKTFYIISSVQVGVCLLSIPMYIFGKKNRAFFSRNDLLKRTRLW